VKDEDVEDGEATRSDSGVKMEFNSEEEQTEEEEPNEHDPVSLLNDSGADVKDLISSIECNEMDKKFLERLKRKLEKGDEESESYEHDTPPLCLITDCQEELARRSICIANILRNLSFIPGNDREMSRHNGLLSLAGQVLLLHHWHPKRRRNPRTTVASAAAEAASSKEDSTVSAETEEESCCTAGQGGGNTEEWWWDTLDALREHMLVVLANIAGHLNLSVFSEEICMPVLNGLLHWSVCPSACAQDPLPNLPSTSVLSAQRLVLEALCKLCVTDTNVDLLLATPPFSRIVQLFTVLVRQLADRNDQVLREFSIVLLSSLVAGDSSAARAVALQHPAISLLIDFIESAEQSAAQLVNSQGMNGMRMLQDNPELMGTTLDMLRRAAAALKHLAAVPENRSLFLPQQDRILALVMSHVLDNSVSKLLSGVLFLCSSSPADLDNDGDEDTAS